MKHCGSWRVPYLLRAPCVQVASSLGMQDCQSGTNAGPRKAFQDLVIDDADHVPIPFQRKTMQDNGVMEQCSGQFVVKVERSQNLSSILSLANDHQRSHERS